MHSNADRSRTLTRTAQSSPTNSPSPRKTRERPRRVRSEHLRGGYSLPPTRAPARRRATALHPAVVPGARDGQELDLPAVAQWGDPQRKAGPLDPGKADGARLPDSGHRHRPPIPPGLGPQLEAVWEPPRLERHQGLPNYTNLPVADRSFHDCVIRSNDVAGFEEEGISLDANAGGPDSPGNDTASTIQGTSPLAAVDAATDTETLAQPPGGQWTGLENAKGAWLSFNQGGAVGRYLQIVAVDAVSRRLTLSDPNDYLARAAAGDPVSVTSPFRHIPISDNVINAEGSRTGIDFHGPVYRSRMANNTITGKPSYSYPRSANVRLTPDGLSAPQSARVTTLADGEAGAMTPRPHVGVASYNSVVGNNVSWDLSFNTAMSTTYRGIPAYASANTSANGVANYNDGSYVFLTSDPNP